MRIHKNKRAERGQVAIYVVLILSFVLIAFAGLAVDYTHMWSKRQEVQGAADAVCQAGAMDLYLYALGQQTANMGFNPATYGVGGNFLCSAVPGAAPCIISKFNGFDPSVAANTIKLTFPGTVPGFTPPPVSLGITYPYLQVDMTQDVPTYLAKIVRGNTPVKVGGHATCGLTVANGPIPLIILHKTKPGPPWQGSLDIGGTPTVRIVGGPQQSIRVNSSDPTAFHANGGSQVNLTLGGPTNQGSDLAVLGGPMTAPSQFVTGSAGHYLAPYSPIPDPYALWPAPAVPPVGVKTTGVAFGTNGCPDPTGCTEYTAGSYAAGITVKGNETAIFRPGVYYLSGNLSLQSNSTVRSSLHAGDGTGGTVLYFSGAHTLNVNSNSGKQARCTSGTGLTGSTYKPKNCVLPYDPTGTANPLAGVSVSRALQCPGGGPNPSQLNGVILDGNIMLGTCGGISPGQSFNYGDPSGQYRGMLFFQDRASAVNASWDGGGQFLLAGYMYFHQCKAGGGGTNCSNPGSGGYGTTLTLVGGAGSGTYTMGNITTDALSLQGNSTIYMILAPANFPNQLFVQLMK